MLFVYHFENHPLYGPAAANLFHATEEGRCRIVTSVVSLLEVLVVPKRQHENLLCQRYRETFAFFPNLSLVAVDTDIVEIASDIRAEHNVRTPDAIQLATAIHAGADAFVSADRYLAKFPGIRVLTLQQAARAVKR